MQISPCLHCHNKPTMIEMYGVYYMQCNCGNWNPYEFAGIRKITAIAQWNIANAIPNYILRAEHPIPNADYIYFINGQKMSLHEAANICDTSVHYICVRFKKGNKLLDHVVIKGITIERRLKKCSQRKV